MGLKRALEKLIANAVRDELDRTLDRAVEPSRANVEAVIAEIARKAAAPLQGGR